MTKPEHYDELSRLIAQALEGRITPQELARLEKWLKADPLARLLYFQHVDLHVELSCLVSTMSTSPVAARPFDDNEFLLPLDDSDGNKRKRWPWVSAAAGILLTLGGVLVWMLFWQAEGAPPAATVASLGQIQGTIVVRDAGGQSETVTNGVVIKPGGTVQTGDEESSAVLSYADGSKLVLGGRTTVLFQESDGKNVELREGILAASVTRQPKPMIVSTPLVKVEVLGTRFSVQSDLSRTEVSVQQGRVRVTRWRDGMTLEVAQGEQIVVEQEKALRLDPIPSAPPTWSENFADGIPAEWQTGEPVRDNLPPGSHQAVRGVRDRQGKGHLVSTRRAWSEGLCQLRDDSTLHVTFKRDRPGKVHFVIHARSIDPSAAAPLHLLSVTHQFMPKVPVKWQHVRIPLSELLQRFRGNGPLGQAFVYSVTIHTDEPDPSLTVDRIAITAP